MVERREPEEWVDESFVVAPAFNRGFVDCLAYLPTAHRGDGTAGLMEIYAIRSQGQIDKFQHSSAPSFLIFDQAFIGHVQNRVLVQDRARMIHDAEILAV